MAAHSKIPKGPAATPTTPPIIAPVSVLVKYATIISAINSFNFSLTPEEGYGEHDSQAVIVLDKKIFIVDGVLQEELLVVGNTIPLQDQHGNPFQGKVTQIENDKVTVDLNHPFAGKSLFFSGSVLEVRAANQEELK